MFEVFNDFSWAAEIYLEWGKNKEFQDALVIKQSFDFDLNR